ncbi:MAG TPA: TonB-dependent receptor [Kofleriaceae bacterium]|nr:TonB-dependent receptor [Kofleriaceae bacterium]
MKTTLLQVFMAIGIVGAAVALSETEARAQATVGSVRGQVRDKATGEAAVGATVVATSAALQGEQVVLADESGLYFITSLPPGSYTLTVYYQDGTFTRGNVVVQVGKEAVVNITVDSAATTGKPKGETIEIQGSAPVIDQGSTKTGVSITSDYTKNVPVGRTFSEVIGGAASAQSDRYGTSLSGSTSVENTYVVEGINTTDTGRGGVSSNLPNEFVSETEVITGGYNAEYGRATGGIINVVTKQGSNQLHGSVFAYYKPGSFSAAANQIQKEGGSIANETNLDYAYDIGAELGGPIIKDKLWFHVGFNPSRTREMITRTVQQQIDKDGDGVPDVDPNTGITLHERVASRDIPEALTTYFFTAKINGEIDQNNQFQLSLFGNPRSGDVSVNDPLLAAATPNTFAVNDTLFNRSDGAYDISAKYTSKFNNGQTQIDALAGFHRGYSDVTAPSGPGGLPLTEYKYTRSLYDFADIEGPAIAACQDGGPNDMYPGIQNCPVDLYTEQGLGVLEKRTNDRISALLSATQRVKALGYHVLKGGIDIEAASYDSTKQFTGGQAFRRFCNKVDPTSGTCADNPDDPMALPGEWRISQYAGIIRNLTPEEAANPGSVNLGPGQQINGCSGGLALCGQVDKLVANTTNRSIGAYLQDSWQIRPNLTLNAGLRFEQQVLKNAEALAGTVTATGEIIPGTAFSLNNWAPRIGAIYDPTSEGKSKLFVHWGRFYENIPNDINVRSFGGEIDYQQFVNVNHRTTGSAMYDPNCDVNHGSASNPASVLPNCADRRSASLLGGGSEYVAPGITGQYIDEVVLGGEYEFVSDIKIGATYTHRTIPNVIEDMSADGANNYLVANPGHNYDDEAAKLEAQAMDVMATNSGLAEALLQRASSLRFVKNFDKPSRTYDALTLRVEQRPTRRSLLVASYTYSMERGNYPGLFSTETNQLDPNITSLYDLPDLMANRYGPLGLDRPHNLKVDGFYQFDIKDIGLFTAGGSFRAQSGIAHNVLASHPVYGDGESYLLPRGSVSRSPLSSNVDIHLSYGRRLDKNMTLEGFINVFNLFDQQDELSVDENYTTDNALPIVGGDPNDLKHAKAVSSSGVMTNSTLVLNKNFDHTDRLTPPRSMQFGMRLTF